MTWGSEWGSDVPGRSVATVENFGKIPVTVVELRLDVCQHYFGNTPCTATAAHGSECYRTRATCQDTANYAVKSAPEVYRFLSKDSPLITGFDAWRRVVKVSAKGSAIDQKMGLPGHSTVTVTLEDWIDEVDLHDPYRHRRASRGGYFFSKLLKRNEHYRNREVWIYEGTLTKDGTLLLGSMNVRRFIIESIEIKADGQVQVTGKSILKRLDDVKIPAETAGVLASDITSGALSFTIKANTGAEGDYPTGQHWVRIGDELIEVESRSGTTFTVAADGRGSTPTKTAAAAHSEGDAVQLCKVYQGSAVDTVLLDLLSEAGIGSSLVDTSGLDDEVDFWLLSHTNTMFLSVPTSIRERVRTILQSCNSYVWWDDELGKIRFKHIAPLRPDEDPVELTVSDVLEDPPLSIGPAEHLQLTRQSVNFGVRDWSKDVRSDRDRVSVFAAQATHIDATAEADEEVGRVLSGKTILAYNVPSELAVEMQGIVFRLVSRNRLPPRELTFSMETSKAHRRRKGDVISLTHPRITDASGVAVATQFLITGKERNRTSRNVWDFTAVSTGFDDRWCFLHTTSAADYDSATDTEKRYGYLAGSDELVEGDPPYLLI